MYSLRVHYMYLYLQYRLGWRKYTYIYYNMDSCVIGLPRYNITSISFGTDMAIARSILYKLALKYGPATSLFHAMFFQLWIEYKSQRVTWTCNFPCFECNLRNSIRLVQYHSHLIASHSNPIYNYGMLLVSQVCIEHNYKAKTLLYDITIRLMENHTGRSSYNMRIIWE